MLGNQDCAQVLAPADGGRRDKPCGAHDVQLQREQGQQQQAEDGSGIDRAGPGDRRRRGRRPGSGDDGDDGEQHAEKIAMIGR